MSNVTQTSGKLKESIANFMKKLHRANQACLNCAQYKYHFPFPTHEPKTANLRERKYANLLLDYSNEKIENFNSQYATCQNLKLVSNFWRGRRI